MSLPNLYKIVWSSENESGELPDEYVGLETAVKAGREWEAEMVATGTILQQASAIGYLDSDPVTANREYQWEVVRVDPPIYNHPPHEETPHEHDRQD